MQNYKFKYNWNLSKLKNRLIAFAENATTPMRSETYYHMYLQKFKLSQIAPQTIDRCLRQLVTDGKLTKVYLKNRVFFGSLY